MPSYEVGQFLDDVYEAEFRGRRLHHRLKSWQDKIEFRNAVHEFLNRRGAEIQPLRRKAAEFTLNCYYEGPTWRSDYDALVKDLDEGNKGSFVHPLLGEMPAAAQMLTATVTPAQAKNLIEFTLVLIEDRVDTLLAADFEPAPAALAASIIEQTDALAVAVEAYYTARAAAQSYIDQVVSYAALAEAAAGSFVIDPAVPRALSASGRLSEAAIQALLRDPGNVSDASLYDILAAIEVSYATALDLDDALRALRPQPVKRRVPGPGPLIMHCQRWYGGPRALEYLAIIETLNPHVPSAWIPGSMDLLIPPPTIPGA